MLLDLAILVGVTACALAFAAAHCRRAEFGLRLPAWVFGVCALVVAASAGWGFVSQQRAMQRLLDAFEGFAPTYAEEVSRLGHARIGLDTAPDDPGYLAIIERQKRWLAMNPAIADIYTFRVIDGENVLIVDSETDYDRDGAFTEEREQRTDIGEAFGPTEDEERRVMAGEVVFHDAIYADRWGVWVSAYAPMRDETGAVEAALGIDIAASSWRASLAAARRGPLAAGALCVIVVLAGWLAAAARGIALRESRAAAREMAEAKRLAEASAAAKAEFLANMSHEIRTPLTAILGYADMLADGEGATPAEQAGCAQTIRSAGRHLLAVINDILDLSKIEAGRMSIERMETDLDEALRDVVTILQGRAQEKGLALAIELAGPVPSRVMTDPTRLRQVLLNLVGNAVKFTEAGGVTVTVGGGRGGIRFDIEDTGPGLRPEDQARLFEPFSQADSTVTRRHGGTGLGLAICRRLAALMGGSVTLVRSAPGAGSCFRLKLPLEATPGARTMSSFDPGAPARSNQSDAAQLDARVLLVEDGPDNQRLIAAYLSRAGARVDIAGHGRIALDLLERAEREGDAYDLVVTDMQMPEMDGYTLARTIRQRGDATPIVALTAHALADERQRCLDAGCDAYLTKPIDRASLIRACADALGRHGDRAAA
jgi:signal transduction histidine kinase/CheY-like chemotaxis protein